MDKYTRFTDHGAPVQNSAENRSAVISKDEEGNLYFIIFAEGFLLNINLNNKSVDQIFYPDNNRGFPFGSYCGRTGLVYTSAGNMLMEFKPWENVFTFYKRIEDVHVAAWSFDEDEDGILYFGSYSVPGCRLFSYTPETKEIKTYGQMDQFGAYMDNVATDRYGWVYMGVGTEKKGIIAFNTNTYEKRILCSDTERTRGSAYLHKGKDGSVYSHMNADDVGMGFRPDDLTIEKNWLILEKGNSTPIKPDRVQFCHYYNREHTFEGIHSPFTDASFIKHYNIGNNEVVYINPSTKESETIKLSYKTEGAGLSPMVAGPDGKVYGTSNHPMHSYSYDPKTDIISNYGGKFYQEAGGGNICAYAVQDNIIGGAAYYGGKIHIFDTSKPIYTGEETNGRVRNPRLVAKHKEIIRPRSAAAHIDKETFIFGGFGENGGTGGGLCIYNYKTGEDAVIKNEELLKYHSTLCMQVLDDGNLIAGTSTASPCGGTPKVKEAEIYILDWSTRKIIFSCVPIANQPEISLMQKDDNGIIHCITSGSVYFTFNPYIKKVEYIKELSGFGYVVRDGLVKGEKGVLYGLFTNTIYSINTDNNIVNKLAEPPVRVSCGMAYINGRIYFGGAAKESTYKKEGSKDSHLWSYSVQ